MFIFSFFWFFPRRVDPGSARLKKRKKVPGEKLPALTPVPDGADFEQSSLACQEKLLPANPSSDAKTKVEMRLPISLCILTF
jgi:hypothetical protein